MLDPAPYLALEEGWLLLRIARDALNMHVNERARLEVTQYSLTPRLLLPAGVFVTLRHSGALRGCIGYTRSVEPLAQGVADNAVNAASRDPRFYPVRPEELAHLSIEVSVLEPVGDEGSPFIPLQDPQEIVIGRDGLYLETSARMGGGGLLLPQVAVDQGWDVHQFLQGICHKAGMPPGAWKQPGMQLSRFQVQVFEEE